MARRPYPADFVLKPALGVGASSHPSGGSDYVTRVPIDVRVRRLPLRATDLVALACWALAVALFVVAGIVGPEGQCGFDNHEWFAASERRQGYVLAGATLAILAASALLLRGAVGSRGRSQMARASAGLFSLLLAGFTRVLRASGVRLVRLPRLRRRLSAERLDVAY